MEHQFTWLFLIIAVIAIFMNGLLIFLANRALQKPCEIEWAVTLAKVDFILPIGSIIACLIKIISGKDLDIIPWGCQVKGPIDFIVLYLSMLLVALVSFSRVSLKSQLKVTGALKYIIIGYTSVYSILMITAAWFKKFILLPNGIDCSPALRTDNLSTSVVLLLGLSLILCLLVTLGSYISRRFRILLGDYQDSVIPLPDRALSSFTDKTTPLTQANRMFIAIRTAAICIAYFILIVPACVFLIIETVVDTEILPIFYILFDLCLVSITLVNPFLLLFTHSFFTRQLYDLLYPNQYT